MAELKNKNDYKNLSMIKNSGGHNSSQYDIYASINRYESNNSKNNINKNIEVIKKLNEIIDCLKKKTEKINIQNMLLNDILIESGKYSF